jgi:hypothetical protein
MNSETELVDAGSKIPERCAKKKQFESQGSVLIWFLGNWKTLNSVWKVGDHGMFEKHSSPVLQF